MHSIKYPIQFFTLIYKACYDKVNLMACLNRIIHGVHGLLYEAE